MSPAPKSMNTAIPLAVDASTIEPRERDRGDDRDPEREREQRRDDAVGPPAAERVREHERAERDQHHVGRADRGRAEPAAEQQRAARQRAHEQRLQQPALGIAADRAERQEDGQDRAEEEDREHRQPGERRADDGVGLDARLRRAVKSSAASNACQVASP